MWFYSRVHQTHESTPDITAWSVIEKNPILLLKTLFKVLFIVSFLPSY
jgi:hypothetical protein